MSRLAAGLLLGSLALAWAVRGLDPSLLWRALVLISPGWVAVSLGCVVAVVLAKASRWAALYGPAQPRILFRDLLSVLLAAQMVNLVIPIRLGEVIRIGLMKQLGRSGPVTVATILLEKTLDLLAAGLLGLALVVLAVVPAWLRQPAAGLLLAGLALVAGLLLAWWQRCGLERFLVAGPGRLLPGWVHRAAHALVAGLGTLTNGPALAWVVFWTGVTWLVSLLAMVALFAAFGLQLPLAAAMLLMLAVSTSNIVPSPPALVGVVHAIAVVVLGQYGIDQARALGFGIVLHLVTVAPLLMLGSWSLWFRAGPVLAWVGGRTSRPAAEG